MPEEIYDLRSFIERLDAQGELARVKAEVDWKYELGAVARRVFRPPEGPALLFENVKDYSTPVFVGGLGTVRRIAMALGLDPDTDETSLLNEYIARLDRPIKPVIIKDGPCKENKDTGDRIDVLKFPVPLWGEKDGGRYIGTWHQVVTRDPDAGWTNVGTYRMMVHEPDICGIHFSPFQHIGQMFVKYKKMNRPMPVAVSIGNDPVAIMVSASPFPADVDEWDMAGALRERPIELVKCETLDLEVPAHCEIVLEGEIPPDEQRQEGPFAEHSGYYATGIRTSPIMRIHCVTYRNNPILRGSPLGMPITEHHRLSGLAWTTQAMAVFKAAGFPGVTAVHCPPGGDPELTIIVAIRKNYASQGIDAGRLLLSSKGKQTKHVIVVDEDINVFDLNEVLWAINTRTQASRAVHIFRNESGSRVDPSVPCDSLGITDKMIIDATWPTTPDYPPRDDWEGQNRPLLVKTSEALEKQMENRWLEYGID
ncbi:MAG: UbiD family decarboxylase [Deltaproteobacteria bacterium]|nr:UbiD family decarboxylase [Deltaproteobacteria bacterium]